MDGVRTIMNAEQYLLVETDGPSELVRGELMCEPSPGWRHGKLTMRLAVRIATFVEAHRLGETFGAETGFLLHRDPDTVRAPDFAFVSRTRAAPFVNATGHAECAPELVAEVLSPSDRMRAVREKIADWLGAGSIAVVIVDPERQGVMVHRANAPAEILGVGDVLRIPDVLPGFECTIAEIFGPLPS